MHCPKRKHSLQLSAQCYYYISLLVSVAHYVVEQ